jgi:hypothetical protein
MSCLCNKDLNIKDFCQSLFGKIDKSKLFEFCKSRNFRQILIGSIYGFIDNKYDYDISWKAKLYLYVNDISGPKNCYCGKPTTFVSTTKGFREFCSTDCAYKSNSLKERRRITNIERYGFENPMKSDKVKLNHKKSIINKYGVDNISKSMDVKIKKEKSMIDKYGVKFNSQREEVKEVISNKMTLYNIENNTNRHINHWIDKLGELNLEFVLKELNSIVEIKCPIGDHSFKIHKTTFNDRISNNTPICTVCNPVGDFSSHKENDLFNWLSGVYKGEIIQSYRDGLEIDIYLPDLKIGFEFNGLYWHSEKYKEKNYHKYKTDYFLDRGIRVIHIWEDDWDLKCDIVKSQITNILGMSNRVFARKCEIFEIEDVKIFRNFLNDNHIQGYVSSKIKIGLFYEGELVSLMSFDKFEGRKKMGESEWNLNRFCNKIGYSVVGGFSKLLNFFVNRYTPKRITSYSDSSWSLGDLYISNKFIMYSDILPDYKYVTDKVRVNKSNFKKSITNVSEKNLNIPKIWDCGKKKWVRFF